MFLIKPVVYGKKNSVLPWKLVPNTDVLETLGIIRNYYEQIICQEIRQCRKTKYL